MRHAGTAVVAGPRSAVSIRFLPVLGETDPWIGYLARWRSRWCCPLRPCSWVGVFFAPDVAGKAFWTSLGLGVGLFLLVGVLLVAVDTASRGLCSDWTCPC